MEKTVNQFFDDYFQDFIPIEIEDKKYTANIQIEEKTDPKETETQEKETDVVLIVLLCVFVPIAFVFLIIFLVCLLMVRGLSLNFRFNIYLKVKLIFLNLTHRLILKILKIDAIFSI